MACGFLVGEWRWMGLVRCLSGSGSRRAAIGSVMVVADLNRARGYDDRRALGAQDRQVQERLLVIRL
jgi:hypothetical protein